MQIQFPAFRICISSCSSSPSCLKILPRLFNAIHLSWELAVKKMFNEIAYKSNVKVFFS